MRIDERLTLNNLLRFYNVDWYVEFSMQDQIQSYQLLFA